MASNGYELRAYRIAFEQVMYYAYGSVLIPLTRNERFERRQMDRLLATIGQLELIDDTQPFELGFRCPAQLRLYRRVLARAIHLAYLRGMDKEILRVAEDGYTLLWQVHNEVNHLYQGLS